MQKEEFKEELKSKTGIIDKTQKIGKRRVAFSRLKRRIFSHNRLLRILVIGIFLFAAVIIGNVFFKAFAKSNYGQYAVLAKDFVFTPREKIKSINERTNVLILGKGGAGHEAPDLTDTIIFTSISHEEGSVKTVSLPRDIWIPELRTKLNSIYYWGNQREEGGGIILAKSSVEEIVGQPIHYALIIDFSSFKEIVDVLGGIEVEVERDFADEKFPIEGREDDECGGDPEFKCRYEVVQFEEGVEHMDGERALKFVRSRNAKGDEGTDFARSARQQKVIAAIKNKLLSWEVLTSPKTLSRLKDAGLSSIETDITPSAGAILARRILQTREDITPHVIPEDLLERPPYLPQYDNLYVFIPKAEDPSANSGRGWSEVRGWVDSVLDETD